MSITRGTRTRLILAFVAMAAMMFALVPAGPASAAPAVAATAGTATLNQGVGVPSGTGSFSSIIGAGAHATPPAAGLGTVSASFSYSDPLIVTGTASGTITAGGGGVPTHSCGFTWTRVGVTAVLTFSGGSSGCQLGSAAVAAFAPTSVPGSVPATAAVAGVGWFVH